MESYSNHIISTILKHDSKQTSYKIALLRAINDVVLSFPDLRTFETDIAIPLRKLAEFWVAYYWGFIDSEVPILQGTPANRGGKTSYDMAFRPTLTHFKQLWEQHLRIPSNPSDGFFIVNELRLPRKAITYSPKLIAAYEMAIKDISRAIQQPIQYAGQGQWSVFAKPSRWDQLPPTTIPIPNTQPSDLCLVVPSELWHSFIELSLWIEALCIHEWCLFTERVAKRIERGTIYQLLTERPDNRRPLTWEINQIDLLLLEGKQFTCPWTTKIIRSGVPYDIDHLLPVSIYPINELWNLVPADPDFNRHTKRQRLPSSRSLTQAQPHLQLAYEHYCQSNALFSAICEDTQLRFSRIACQTEDFPTQVTHATIQFIQEVAQARNLETF